MSLHYTTQASGFVWSNSFSLDFLFLDCLILEQKLLVMWEQNDFLIVK